MLLWAVGIVALAVDVGRRLESASSASTDNVQWSLSQVDVELLQLILAIDIAQAQPGLLAEVRLRFDILYSRIETLGVGGVFRRLRNAPEFEASYQDLARFATGQAGLIDGPDDTLQQGLPRLAAMARGLQDGARLIALAGMQGFARITDQERQQVEETLILLGALTLLLVATLVGTVVVLIWLYRGNQRKEAENLETLSQLDSIVRTALDAVITVDAGGRVVDFNPAAATTFGYTPMEAIGMEAALLFAEGGGAVLTRELQKDARGRGRLRVMARRKDGHDFPAESSISPTASGANPLFILFLRDLSAQVASEQALMKARDDALAGEKAKADLLVVMSHEIRTPLNGMIGTIELLDSSDLLPHQREYLRIMEASGKLLMHHVNDVLDIARLDSGKAPLSLGPVDLTELVREVFDNQSPASQTNGNRLTLVPPTDGRAVVIGDAAQLRQVLLNLVGNAVKFTKAGQITVEIKHLSPQGPTEIEVADTGIGIARQDLDRIFDDFVTLDPSYARPVSGTGLGLGIVRRIVARMGGTLAVDSLRGKGSTFRISLPLHILDGHPPFKAPDTPKVAPLSGTGKWLTLVVEDNDFNRLIMRDMLVNEGHEVIEARDGEEGIRMGAKRAFDLILMDISMPGMDGLQAASLIRAKGASRNSPIIALTAHALQKEIDRFHAGGMQQILIKPVTRETLRAALAGVLEGRMISLPAPRNLREKPLVDSTVLRNLAADIGAERARVLVRKFIDETDASIAQLVQIGGGGSDLLILRDVHRLEGATGMFGALALHEVLSRIESLCKAGAKDEARAALSALPVLWQSTAAAYREFGDFPQASSLR